MAPLPIGEFDTNELDRLETDGNAESLESLVGGTRRREEGIDVPPAPGTAMEPTEADMLDAGFREDSGTTGELLPEVEAECVKTLRSSPIEGRGEGRRLV